MSNLSRRISVVVCSLNGAHRITPTIESLTTQTVPVQVFVVDDGSTDATAEVATRFPGVVVLTHLTNLGLSAARNTGLTTATTPLVAFTDDDVTPPPTWIGDLLAAWDKAPETTTALGGAVTVAEQRSFTQRYLVENNPLAPLEIELVEHTGLLARLRLYLNPPKKGPSTPRPVYSLVGANFSLDRAAALHVGGFDPDIRFGGDEEYLCVLLRAAFGPQTLWFDPTVSVAHRFAPELRDTWRRDYAYGLGQGRRWRSDGGMPSLRPGAIASLVMALALTPISAPIGLFAAVGVAFLVRFRFLTAALERRSPVLVTYPLITLGQELCNTAGFAAGALRAGVPPRGTVRRGEKGTIRPENHPGGDPHLPSTDQPSTDQPSPILPSTTSDNDKG